MGTLDEQKLAKRDARKGGGAGRQVEANTRNLGGLRRRRTRRKVSWADTDAAGLGALIVRASYQNAALLFGTTRDGGALTLTIYWDGDRETLYVNDPDELENTLSEVWDLFPETLEAAEDGATDIPF